MPVRVGRVGECGLRVFNKTHLVDDCVVLQRHPLGIGAIAGREEAVEGGGKGAKEGVEGARLCAFRGR